MLVLFDPLKGGNVYPRYEVLPEIQYWRYTGTRDGWEQCFPDRETNRLGVEIHMAAPPVGMEGGPANEDEWVRQAKEWVKRVFWTAPSQIQTLLIPVDKNGAGMHLGFLGASEISPQEPNASLVAHWVLAAVVEGLGNAYAIENVRPRYAKTCWQMILDAED